MYKLRIDTDARDSVCRLLDKYCSEWIIGFEEQGNDNPHCHVYLKLLCKQATFRNRIRQDFGKGNGSYSLKELKEEYPLEYLAYVVKERDYKYSSNFPNDVISKSLTYDDKVKREKKEKKKDRLPVWKKIMLECKDLEYDRDAYRKIAERVVEYHLTNEILVRRFALKSYTDTIYLQMFPRFSSYDLVKWIADN